MRRLVFLLLLLCTAGCSLQEGLQCFCTDDEGDFASDFIVWCPAVGTNNHLPRRFGSPPDGEGMSIPIRWSGLPEGTKRIQIKVVDATCTYDCDACCQFVHWFLDLNVSELAAEEAVSIQGIEEGSARNPYLLEHTSLNSREEKGYVPFFTLPFQTHALVIQVIAYAFEEEFESKVIGRAQSRPFLFSSAQP